MDSPPSEMSLRSQGRALDDPVLMAVCNVLVALFDYPSKKSREPRLQEILLEEREYVPSAEPPTFVEPNPPGAEAPRGSLRARLEFEFRRKYGGRTLANPPSLSGAESLQWWLLRPEHLIELTKEQAIVKMNEMREKARSSIRDQLPRMYPIGSATFTVLDSGEQIYLQYQVGPVFGKGAIYRLVPGKEGPHLEIDITDWVS